MPAPVQHDLFISYIVDPDESTFFQVKMGFEMLGLKVFNPDLGLSGFLRRNGEVGGAAVDDDTGEKLKRAVGASTVLLVVLRRGAPYFRSKWCRLELHAAMEARIPAIPVYDANNSALNDIKDIIDVCYKGRDAAKWPEHRAFAHDATPEDVGSFLGQTGLTRDAVSTFRAEVGTLIKYLFKQQIMQLVSSQLDGDEARKIFNTVRWTQ